jgi:hypothetical protein
MPLGVQSGYLDSGSEKASTRSALSDAEARMERSVAYKRLRRARRWRIGQSLMSMTGGTWPSLEITYEAHFRILRRCGTRIGQGWLDSDQRTLASKARALSRLSYTHDDDSLEREARQ